MIIFLNSLLLFGQTPSNDPHWQLVWEDEFNSLNLDNTKWTAIDWADGNNATIFLKENVSINNGNLVLTVKNNPIICESNHPPTIWGARAPCVDNKIYPYNSGWVETTQLYNTQFGYIESRIKIPYWYGFWPAFWTFVGPGITNFTNYAEIDIFEMLGHSPSNEITTNIHLNYPDGNIYFQKQTPTNYDYNNTWHTYGIEWSPSKIIWYVDGSPIRLFPNHGIIDPVRIILNLSIETTYLPNYSTPFPSVMLVDYVKVYDLKNDCNTIINTCNYNFSTYDNKVKKEIVIGGGACVNSIPNNTNMFLRATDGVLINGDFTVPVGSELYIDVNPCY